MSSKSLWTHFHKHLKFNTVKPIWSLPQIQRLQGYLLVKMQENTEKSRERRGCFLFLPGKDEQRETLLSWQQQAFFHNPFEALTELFFFFFPKDHWRNMRVVQWERVGFLWVGLKLKTQLVRYGLTHSPLPFIFFHYYYYFIYFLAF